MSLFANIVGFSVFGLAARIGQLGIQRRNLLESAWKESPPISPPLTACVFAQPPLDPGAHLVAMGVFGSFGYWVHQWDQRAGVLLSEKRAEIVERRQREIAKAEEVGAAGLVA